jgi:hypothetical protein
MSVRSGPLDIKTPHIHVEGSKDENYSRKNLRKVFAHARLNLRRLSCEWFRGRWLTIANLAFTIVVLLLVAIFMFSDSKTEHFSMLYVSHVRILREDASQKRLIFVQISLHESAVLDDIKNVVKSSTVAEKVLGGLLDSKDVPKELSIYLTAYCFGVRSTENAEPLQCVPISFRYCAYAGFGTLLIISLCPLILPFTRLRSDKRSWFGLQVAWGIVLIVHTLLFLDVFIMSWLLASNLPSRYFQVQQGEVLWGFMGVVDICLAVVLVISILQPNKEVISGVKNLQ